MNHGCGVAAAEITPKREAAPGDCRHQASLETMRRCFPGSGKMIFTPLEL
jgi:hypothetical protein